MTSVIRKIKTTVGRGLNGSIHSSTGSQRSATISQNCKKSEDDEWASMSSDEESSLSSGYEDSLVGDDETDDDEGPPIDLDMDFLQVAAKLKTGLDIKDRMYHFKTYKRCFVASEAIDFMLQEQMVNTRFQAVQLGRQLQINLQLWNHVCNEHEFKDELLFFRFVSDGDGTNNEKEGRGETLDRVRPKSREAVSLFSKKAQQKNMEEEPITASEEDILKNNLSNHSNNSSGTESVEFPIQFDITETTPGSMTTTNRSALRRPSGDIGPNAASSQETIPKQQSSSPPLLFDLLDNNPSDDDDEKKTIDYYHSSPRQGYGSSEASNAASSLGRASADEPPQTTNRKSLFVNLPKGAYEGTTNNLQPENSERVHQHDDDDEEFAINTVQGDFLGEYEMAVVEHDNKKDNVSNTPSSELDISSKSSAPTYGSRKSRRSRPRDSSNESGERRSRPSRSHTRDDSSFESKGSRGELAVPTRTSSRSGSSYLRGRRDKRTSSSDKLRVSKSVERELQTKKSETSSSMNAGGNSTSDAAASSEGIRPNPRAKVRSPPRSKSSCANSKTSDFVRPKLSRSSSSDRVISISGSKQRPELLKTLGLASSRGLGDRRNRPSAPGRSKSGDSMLLSMSAPTKRRSNSNERLGGGSNHGGGVRRTSSYDKLLGESSHAKRSSSSADKLQQQSSGSCSPGKRYSSVDRLGSSSHGKRGTSGAPSRRPGRTKDQLGASSHKNKRSTSLKRSNSVKRSRSADRFLSTSSHARRSHSVKRTHSSDRLSTSMHSGGVNSTSVRQRPNRGDSLRSSNHIPRRNISDATATKRSNSTERNLPSKPKRSSSTERNNIATAAALLRLSEGLKSSSKPERKGDNSESSSEDGSFGCDNDDLLDEVLAGGKKNAENDDSQNSINKGGLGDSYLGLFEKD